MTEDNTTESVDKQDSGDAEDSTLVKDLRKQIRDLSKEVKAAPSRSDIEAEVRASVARQTAIESELVALDMPAGLLETVEGKLGGKEVTAEAVAETLTAIGFVLTDTDDGDVEDDGADANLADVANLGSQVAQAAKAQRGDNLADLINSAESPEELADIMREAGLGT